eukprot:CAMPEP_0113297720 /NCGR_PEP_ID=MMETSP0010_2-20120614/464_1 /TAXON_ID=216773 ORGANISM="Corethron hystrix, Strain 308" /NCGR_SAMPLE_ID=MMETSP0010_2 /ASSEMBLY_ACC=CAM_ASM_000155 /LENGTH=231 /DNA_ID=CAMNT_0000150655 /DNA_START=50 /DNA_END=745 /DNA_ORIENTATION=+ /assembly_acc=CAM_ASM_000155
MGDRSSPPSLSNKNDIDKCDEEPIPIATVLIQPNDLPETPPSSLLQNNITPTSNNITPAPHPPPQPVGISPASALLAFSFPLFIGGVIGYRRAISQYSEEGAQRSQKKNLAPRRGIHKAPPSTSAKPTALAFHALGLGTVLCVGTASFLLGTCAFLAGVRDVEGTVRFLRGKGLEWRNRAETVLGVNAYGKNRMALEEESKAVHGMNEGEEVDYWLRRIGVEIEKKDEEEK